LAISAFFAVKPTASVSIQLVDDGLDLVPAVAAGDFTKLLLEAVMYLVRPRQLDPWVQSVSEELAGLQRRGFWRG